MVRRINWLRDVMPVIKQRLGMWASQQIVPTLRGLFYTLVSLNIIENTSTKYDYLSQFTSRAREKSRKRGEIRYRDGKGYIHKFLEEEILPIDCFADNVRRIIDIEDDYHSASDYINKGLNFYVNPDNYRIPRWHNQSHYVEVWVEKDAMAATLNSIINIAGHREVRIVPTRGQESVTFAWENVQRLKQKQYEGKQIHIRYFGDLDPSGEAIERSLIEKLTTEPYRLRGIDFKRVGVTNEQRLRFSLIPNTDEKTLIKLKRDTNRFSFMQKYGLINEDDLFQIEVDALEAIAPQDFREMVLESVDEYFDEDVYRANLEDREITPKKQDFKALAAEKLAELLESQKRDDEL